MQLPPSAAIAVILRCPGFRKRLLFMALVTGLYFLGARVPAWSQASDILNELERAPVNEAARPRTRDWSVTIGGGVALRPAYEGSEEFKASPAPLVDITWKNRVFLSGQHGLGAYVIRTQRARLGLSLGYAPGRDEDNADRLRGLGDIDPGARGYLFGAYSLGLLRLHVDISQDFGGSDGLQIQPGATLMYPFSERIKISASFSATWANDDHMETFFGVSPTQSAASGLPAFGAAAGFKRADLKLGTTWDMTERWFIRTNLRFGYLLGDAGDSPITESRLQPSVGMFVGYRF